MEGKANSEALIRTLAEADLYPLIVDTPMHVTTMMLLELPSHNWDSWMKEKLIYGPNGGYWKAHFEKVGKQ